MDINEKDGMIFTSSGEPFENEQAAKMRAGILLKNGIPTTPMSYDKGGYVLVREKTPAPPRRRRKFWEEPSPLFISESDKDPRFDYRVVNEDENYWRNRVQTLYSAGWDVDPRCVPIGDGSSKTPAQLGGSVSTIPVGKGVKGILMRKLKEHYAEDYAEKQKENDAIMAQVKGRPEFVEGGAKVLPGVTNIEEGVFTG